MNVLLKFEKGTIFKFYVKKDTEDKIFINYSKSNLYMNNMAKV
jgi:hypothetical protein